VRYAGVNNGAAITGQTYVSSIAEFVEGYYRRGFRQLTVTEVRYGETIEVGRIGETDGRRTWWAEDAPGEEPAHAAACQCAGRGVCAYWNTVPHGPRAE
jgi:hypothetical protein